MDKLTVAPTMSFSELVLEEYNTLRYSIYVLDFDWNYLFVNQFVLDNLKKTKEDLLGKNMWTTFTELNEDPYFVQMKIDVEKGKPINFVSNSPLTNQRLNVVGTRLKDCYFFYSSILPKKDELMNELRQSMQKKPIDNVREKFIP
jgi:hypothetical protein